MLKLQLIAAAALVLGGLYIIRLIRKRKIELKYALPWLAVALIVLVVDCFPGILSGLADLLGIATPVNALFLLALCFSVCLIFILTVVVSRQSDRIKRLAQAVAINEEQIRQLSAMADTGVKQEEALEKRESGTMV